MRPDCDIIKMTRQTSPWISVEDGLPEPFVSVLGSIKGARPLPVVRECWRTSEEGDFYFPSLFEHLKITHWRRMPEAPPCE